MAKLLFCSNIFGVLDVRDVVEFLLSMWTIVNTQPFYCSSGICPGPPGWTGTRKVQPGRLKSNLDLLEQRDSEWQWQLLSYMQCLLPSTSCKVSPCGRHMVHLIPHSTHPQSSSLHGAVKAGSLSEIEKRALPRVNNCKRKWKRAISRVGLRVRLVLGPSIGWVWWIGLDWEVTAFCGLGCDFLVQTGGENVCIIIVIYHTSHHFQSTLWS